MKKKMTKLFAILLAVSLFCLLLAGCNAAPNFTEEDYESLEIFAVDAAEGSNVISVEKYPLWGTNSALLSSEKEPAKTMEIEFEGKTYKGEFLNSTVKMHENYRTDTYISNSGPSFDVNASTGELTYISPSWEKEGKEAVSDAKRKEIALELAGKYIDTNKYKLDIVNTNTVTHYMFTKKMDGILTWETLDIGVSEFGQVVLFKGSMLGAYPDRTQDLPEETQKQLNLLRSDGAKSKVLEQIKTTAKVSEECKFTVLKGEQLVLLENDTWGIIYGVQIEYPQSEIQAFKGQYETINVLVK